MKINHTDLGSYNISELLLKGDRYLIPVYQRNYEWGKEQIEQLLLDVKDYFTEESGKKYYLGTLIVDKVPHKAAVYETIDGQQRLTTINIICCAMREMDLEISQYFQEPIISFESRKNADDTLAFIYHYKSVEEPRFFKYNVGIWNGMRIAKEILVKIQNELGDEFGEFVTYFFTKVFLLRVQVPPDTDMNHYFEIMNSRGEQLEKHEILKARLMKEFNSEPDAFFLRRQFNFIWEACADMNSNIQLHFHKEYRKMIFGNSWFDFTFRDAGELFKTKIFADKGDSGKKNSIDFKDILFNDKDEIMSRMFDAESINESQAEQFQPVINFENLLLHVLKIKEQSDEVSLDDKRLLSFFEETLKNKGDKVKFVKEFCYHLLKTRFVLDEYVLRRKYSGTSDQWSLQSMKYYEKDEGREKDTYSFVNTFGDAENQQILTLLSMFHVSTPTQIYKYWLFAVLNFLDGNLSYETEKNGEKPSQIKSFEYISFLEKLAKNFMVFRHLANEPKNYNDIILRPDTLPKAERFDFENKLSYGNIENNLVFNYTDYLLWKKDFKNSGFEFSFRSSVEHYYPQNPITGELLNQSLLKPENIARQSSKGEKSDLLNCFGNLCLISHRNNSRLSNHMPKLKTEYYAQAKTKDSLKQEVMMNYEKNGGWNADRIFEHHNEMIDLLTENLFHE